MKLILKNTEDFKIFYTGNELRDFNGKFKKMYVEDSSKLKNKKLFYLFGMIFFLLNMYIIYRNASNIITMICLSIIPISTVCLFVFAFFMKKDNIIKDMVKRLTIGCLIFLFAITGVAFIIGDVLVSYLIFIIIFILGIIIGINSWSKRTIKYLKLSDKNTNDNNNKISLAIGASISVIIVPIIRSLKNEKALLSIILLVTSLVLFILLGWALGLGITNLMYYKFITENK